jgi:hypothetical protein
VSKTSQAVLILLLFKVEVYIAQFSDELELCSVWGFREVYVEGRIALIEIRSLPKFSVRGN